MTERAALLLRRRRPIGEPAGHGAGATPGYTMLHASAGAGRVRHALAVLGVTTGALDQAVLDPAVTPSELDRLEVGAAYPVVILGSHLVNTPDAALRRALLLAAARHLAAGGDLLVEHHPVDWAETAAPTEPTPGSGVGMAEVRIDPPFVSAVSTYDAGGRYERVPFTARVLSEAELDEALAGANLRRRRRLGPTWLLAGPG